MRNKLKFLVGVSLARKVKTKWFLIAQLVLLLLIVGMMNIDFVVNAFGGEFQETTMIYVIDDTDKSFSLFKEAFELNEENLYGENSNRYEVVLKESKEEVEDTVLDEGGIIVYFLPSSLNTIEVEVISKENLDTYSYTLISSACNSVKVVLAMDELGLTAEDYTKMMSDVVIRTSLIDESVKNEKETMDMIMSTVFPIIILPIFMLSIFLVQMIGAEVNDEKTTKAMEIIISNVSPKIHFFAKVIAGNIFVIGQAILIIGYGGVALFVRNLLGASSQGTNMMNEIGPIFQAITESPIGDKLICIIPATIVLILLTFIAYALLAGVLASMTTTTEDYQQVQLPIVMISLIGYYLSIMAGVFKGAIIIKIFSFIPFISAVLSPSLLVLGQIGIVEVMVSILVMIFTNYLLIKYGLRIYKVGILNYSSSGLWRKMAKALKNNSIR